MWHSKESFLDLHRNWLRCVNGARHSSHATQLEPARNWHLDSRLKSQRVPWRGGSRGVARCVRKAEVVEYMKAALSSKGVLPNKSLQPIAKGVCQVKRNCTHEK